MTKILVTGGAGFIGSNLALRLVKSGYEVTVLDNLNKQIHGENPNDSFLYNKIKNVEGIRFIKGDVRVREDWIKALKGVDVIAHLAADTGTGQSMYEVARYTDVNVNGTAVMYDILTNEETSVKKVILSSSRAIYGEGKFRCHTHGIVYPVSREIEDMDNGDFEVKCPVCHETVQPEPTDEKSKLFATSVYGVTKQAQEKLSEVMSVALNLPVIIFRFQNVYGPGQSLKNPYTGILSIFSTQIKNQHDLNIFEDGKETRDFVYIDDITHAIQLGIEDKKIKFDIFNVGSGEKTDVLTIANYLKENYRSNIKINVSGNYRVGDIRHNIADISNIETKLGYHPEVSVKEGLKKFVEWVDKQKVEQDNYESSISDMKEKGLYR